MVNMFTYRVFHLCLPVCQSISYLSISFILSSCFLISNLIKLREFIQLGLSICRLGMVWGLGFMSGLVCVGEEVVILIRVELLDSFGLSLV